MRLCRVKFIPFVINSGYVQDSQRYALWASPTISHRGDENNKQAAVYRWQAAKKYTACGLVCRGRPKPFWPVRCRPTEGAGRLPKRTAVAGRPAVIFRHSLAEYDGVFLRATNHGSFPGFKCGNSSSSLATMRCCSARGGRGIIIAFTLFLLRFFTTAPTAVLVNSRLTY